MTTKTKLPEIDPAKLPYSRNAILGIPDSGKTVTAKKLAEYMLLTGTPIAAFDPAGVWRFLRVHGKGAGFPVVVVGGAEPDLPMTDPRQAADIMRAVMKSGVSVVFDLYDPRWSKEDWKKIVEAAINVMWYENKPFGLRHIFLEEAAEFIPQNFSSSDPHAGKLYATIEKIARMGRNAYLGMTLINQRAEGVNKAVLELCPNLLLHRQKGRNSLKNLSKWLEYIDGDIGEHIIASLPTLPTGECWAWTEDHAQPERIKIPMTQSYHPNIAEALGADKVKSAAKKAVNVEEFVTKLRDALPAIEKEAKENDPKALRAEISRLTSENRKLINSPKPDAPDPKAVEEAERRGFMAGAAAAHQEMNRRAGDLSDVMQKVVAEFFRKATDHVPAAPIRFGSLTKSQVNLRTEKPVSSQPDYKKQATASSDAPMNSAAQKMLAVLDTNPPVKRSWTQVATLAGLKARGGHYNTGRRALVESGLIVESGGVVQIASPSRDATAADHDPAALVDMWSRNLSGAAPKILQHLFNNGPGTREEIAEALNMQPRGGHWNTSWKELRDNEIVEFDGPTARLSELFA